MWIGQQQLSIIYKKASENYSADKIVTTIINKLTKGKVQTVPIEYNFYSFINQHDRHHILNIDELGEITVDSNHVMKIPKKLLEKGFFSFQNGILKHNLNAKIDEDSDHYYLHIKSGEEFIKSNSTTGECSPDNLRNILISGKPFVLKLEDNSYFIIHTSGYSDGIFMGKKIKNENFHSPLVVSEINGNESEETLGVNNVLKYCKRNGVSVILELFVNDIKQNIVNKHITHYIHKQENGLGGCCYITTSPNGTSKIKKPHIYIHLLCASPENENKTKGHMLLNAVLNFAVSLNIKHIYISSIVNPIDTFLWWKKQGFEVIYESLNTNK